MKMTVMLGEDGRIIGTHRQREAYSGPGPRTAMRPLPGQTMKEVEVPDHFMVVEDATELHRLLNEHLRTAG